MKTKWFWMMCMIVMTSLVTVSCGDDDDEGGAGNAPEGTITVNLTSSSLPLKAVDGKQYGSLRWLHDTNNLLNDAWNIHISQELYNSEIVSLGERNGLGAINTNNAPKSGWTLMVACKPGCAYITRCPNDNNGELDYCYTGIYVVRNMTDTSGGIAGIEVQYCTFTLGKGWNK